MFFCASFFSVLNSWSLTLTIAGPALPQDCWRLDPEHHCSTCAILEAERGRALCATGKGHITLQDERCKQGQLLERGALSYHSHCSFLCCNTVTRQWNNFWKCWLFSSPVMKFTTQKYIQCRCFQSWAPHVKWKTDMLWQKGQGFWRELREPDSSPAQHLHPAQSCMSHLGQGLRHGEEPQEGFLSITTPVLLCVTGNWGGHQLQRS